MGERVLTGCRGCAFAYVFGGAWQCRKKPHDYQTAEQRAIVAWLSNSHVDPMTSPGCPGYEDGTRWMCPVCAMQAPMADWRPIDTAPKTGGEDGDGPWIFVSDGERIALGFWRGDYQCWCVDDGIVPVYWMPQPPLPKKAGSGGGVSDA